MNKIRAVIIDDAAQARKLLRLMIHEFVPDIEVIAEAENAEAGGIIIQQQKPDIVFLDIEMPGKSGIQLAAELAQQSVSFQLVFTTAYNDYAIEAFRLSALDYLLKPIQENQLIEAAEKIRRSVRHSETEKRLQALISNLNRDQPRTISIPVMNGYENLKLDDVLYVKADGSYTHVALKGNRIVTVSKNLKYFESILEASQEFVRVHRSFIINLHQMKKYERAGRGTIIMNDDAVIDLARDRRQHFLSRLDR